MNFSFSDYQAGLASGLYAPPGGYCPFMRVNRAQYKAMEEAHEKNKNDIARAFRELRRRVCGEYYWRTYPVQVQALDYSQMSFPAYRFILPEVLADDWLAIVGWHKFHRDHVLHQPLTAYVVQKLLKNSASTGQSFLLSDGRPLLDACIDEVLKWDSTAYLKDSLLGMGVRESEPWLNRGPASRTLWKCLFLETAYVAAMFHDMGYPWQYVNLLANKLDQAGYQSESPISDAERLVSAFGNRLLYAPLNGYRVLDNNTPATWRQRLLDITAKAVPRTHGFPGAIGFLYLNDVLRDFPADRTHPIKQFCVEWAAMAIMMHDMRGIYWGDDTRSPPDNDHMRLKFEVDPLSCVITLADVLQDFSRPAAAFRENAASVDVSYHDGCDSARLELDSTNPSRAMKIVYCFSDPREHASKLSFLPKDRREFFDEEYGYLDLSAVGIRGVEMEAELAP
jgi:hypothetical protein